MAKPIKDNMCYTFGPTELEEAIINSDLRKIKKLIKNGAEINIDHARQAFSAKDFFKTDKAQSVCNYIHKYLKIG
jgi:hypothetical protein